MNEQREKLRQRILARGTERISRICELGGSKPPVLDVRANNPPQENNNQLSNVTELLNQLGTETGAIFQQTPVQQSRFRKYISIITLFTLTFIALYTKLAIETRLHSFITLTLIGAICYVCGKPSYCNLLIATVLAIGAFVEIEKLRDKLSISTWYSNGSYTIMYSTLKLGSK